MKRYENYRPGSDRWFPEAPTEWIDSPIWTMFTRDARKGYADETLLSVYRDHGVVPKDSRDDNNNRPSEDLSTYQLVEPGDLVVNKMKAWQGSLSISTHRGIVSPAYFVYRPHHQSDERFLHHLLRSRPLIAAYIGMSKGVRVNQWDLEPQNFSRLKLALPPPDEQRAIADYLDRETARIDTLIEEIGTSIALSGERRSALITAAVTGHIDVDGTAVRLRDSEDSRRSGEVSLPDLPVGWASVPVKRLARVVSGATPKTEVKEHWDGDVVWVTPADMGKSDSHYLAASDRTLSRSGLAGCSAELLPKGTVIVSTRAPIGTIGIADVPLTTNQGCKGLIFHEGDSRFFAYQLSGFAELLNSYGSGSTFLELSSERLKSFTVVRPPLPEQRAIADYLDRETARIDTLIAEQRQLVEYARERRAALITAAVTGQIDVRKDH